MSKCTVVKAVAALLFVLAVACAHRAYAGEEVLGDVFTSGTSFESRSVGSFDYRLTDEGEKSGSLFWSASVTDETATVVLYDKKEAYNYAAHTSCEGRALERNPYLATSEAEKDVKNYLRLNPDQALDRTIFSRLSLDDAFSNVTVKTENRDSIYCDLLARFTALEGAPAVDSEQRISVWLEIDDPDSDEPHTNLMVAAGAFTNGFTHVAPFRCRLDREIEQDVWYRLTIRAHGDVSAKNAGIGGFSLYLDGQPLRAKTEEEYVLLDGVRANVSWLSPEARVLYAERRLFFGYAEPSSAKSLQLSRFHFTGDGSIDDISFSSQDPGYGKPQVVFTLNWDAGFSRLKYTLDGGLTTNAAPVETARSLDLAIGDAPTNGFKLAIVDYAYKTDRGFQPGVWLGENGVTLTNGTEFVYDGTNSNPIAAVASTRDCVTISEGGFDVFRTALKVLDKKGEGALKMLVLETNMVVSTATDSDGNNDSGYVYFGATDPDGEYVLDLNGHTLQGALKGAKAGGSTVLVTCKSLRIIDSSLEQTGRIYPIGSYTNSQSYFNTAIRVRPNPTTGIEPVLTIEDGIVDGWVRNESETSGSQAWTGVVFVEGGEYISTNSETFYLESCVTNPTAQFVYRNGYWTCLTTNAYIWSGMGADNRWTTPENWRAGVVPPAGATALFPSRGADEGPWPVDLGANTLTTTNLWLEGDVYLTGTNHFEDVVLTGGGQGRICGTAQLLYEGEQPGSLTETTLATNWAGTVLLRAVRLDTEMTPLVLKNIDTWGTKDSTVEFNGVRGYVRDTKSRTMAYKLRLKDYVWTNGGVVVTNVAWQNDSGYTGSTLAFKNSLLGDGTFSSGENSRSAIYQLYKFADVSSFTGRLDIRGKRVLIGNAVVSEKKAGLVVFATQAVVPLGLGWTCKRAIFGTAINLLGETNDVLITCTDAKPDVTSCTNVTLNGLANLAWLETTLDQPWSVYATGDRPSYLPEADPSSQYSSLATSFFSQTSDASEDDDYALSARGLAASALTSAMLNSATQAVESADVSISIDGDQVTVTVGNALPGLWYGLRHRASLNAEWEYPTKSEWVQATGNTVPLSCPRTDETGFYGVVATLEDPNGEGADD